MSKIKYNDEFKKTIVTLHNNGKSQSELSREYGISLSAINKWVKIFSEVKIDNDTIITAKQIKQLQKRNAMLEEENIILKKRLPYSRLTQTKIKRCTYS